MSLTSINHNVPEIKDFARRHITYFFNQAISTDVTKQGRELFLSHDQENIKKKKRIDLRSTSKDAVFSLRVSVRPQRPSFCMSVDSI